MQFHHIEPHYLLRNYIEKMWLFETDGKMPLEEMKLVVPNGNLKLTVSFQNGIVASINGRSFVSKEHDITLSGLIDTPVILDVDRDIATQTIGVEFNPRSAYRFFHFRLNDIQNQIYSVSEIFGKAGTQLVTQVNNAAMCQQKINLLQQFLLRQLLVNNEDSIYEYCVQKIIASRGSITVKELEKKTGYSSRWLDKKFKNKLGVSPKNLSSIIRFKQYYSALVNDHDKAFFKNSFYDLYYDQSHFIRDFKRFTGLPPTRLEKQMNEFGKSYYRE